MNTVLVKLVRPQNDLRRKHPDRMFAAENRFAYDKPASTLGPPPCLFLSQEFSVHRKNSREGADPSPDEHESQGQVT